MQLSLQPHDPTAMTGQVASMPDFSALRSQSRGSEAVLFAFDQIEHDGDDLCGLPLIDRNRRLARVIGRAKHAVLFTEHLAGDVAAWGWRASCPRGWTRPTAVGRRGVGQVEEPGK
jgi:ATP-dependent DNA ligase